MMFNTLCQCLGIVASFEQADDTLLCMNVGQIEHHPGQSREVFAFQPQ